MEEPLTDSQIEVEKTPLGIRLTLQFPRLLMVVMIFPLLGSCFLAFMALIVGDFSSAPVPQSIVFGFMGLGSFVLMLALITGTAWMECHLNQSPVPFASTWVAGRPEHPA